MVGNRLACSERPTIVYRLFGTGKPVPYKNLFSFFIFPIRHQRAKNINGGRGCSKMKGKIISLALALVSGLAVLMAVASSSACYPFIAYQPKAPKSLIKVD